MAKAKNSSAKTKSMTPILYVATGYNGEDFPDVGWGFTKEEALDNLEFECGHTYVDVLLEIPVPKKEQGYKTIKVTI